MTALLLARILCALGGGCALYPLWSWALQDGGIVREVRINRFKHEAELRWRIWEACWAPDPRIPRRPGSRQVS